MVIIIVPKIVDGQQLKSRVIIGGNNLKFKLNNELYTIRELSEIYKVSYKSLFNRLVVYKWPIKKAIINKIFYGGP